MLSIIIVSYNTKELVLSCLRSLKDALAGIPSEVIVIDNDSHDDSANAIATTHPDVILIRSRKNLGFGAACNLAADRAKADRYLFLNPDTVIGNDAIRKLLDFARSYPKAGIWGGRVSNAEGKVDPNSCRRFPSLWGLFSLVCGLSRLLPNSRVFNSEVYGGWTRDCVRQVDVVSGCLFLVNAADWQRLGGFEPVFFMYSEEDDFCCRAREFGLKPMVSPDVEIIHHGGMSEPVRSKRLTLLLKGKVTFMNRHWAPARRFFGKILLLLWPLSRCLFFLIYTQVNKDPYVVGRFETWREVWRARRDWIRGYPG